jgi:hypothetical protein
MVDERRESTSRNPVLQQFRYAATKKLEIALPANLDSVKFVVIVKYAQV